jgi:hypothetical protein
MRWITHKQKYYDKFVEPIVALEMKNKCEKKKETMEGL